jgi:hypothetical protein
MLTACQECATLHLSASNLTVLSLLHMLRVVSVLMDLSVAQATVLITAPVKTLVH